MRIPSRNLAFAAGLAGTTVLLAAVAVTGRPGAQEVKPAASPSVVRVEISKGTFNPVSVQVGDSVVWVNKDAMPHSASRYSDDADFMEGGLVPEPFNTGFIQPGTSSAPVTFLQPTGDTGRGYRCDVHEQMLGHVVVRPRPSLSLPPTPSMKTVHHDHLAPSTKPQAPAFHSFVVTGKKGSDLFLHHYSLFNDPNHEFQVTLEARLADAKARTAYETFRARKGRADTRVLVDAARGPKDHEHFLLTRLNTGGGLTSFPATFSTEGEPWVTQWGATIKGLVGVPLEIKRVIQFRHFDSRDTYPGHLVYQLYGNADNVFLAHEVTARPSFLHVVRLAEIPKFLTPDVIEKNPLVAILSKRLTAGGQRSIAAAVLNDNTTILLGPPTGSINPEAPLQAGEVVPVVIEGDGQQRELKIGPTIFYDHRILNR
jgi:plastocyanin